MNRLKLKALKEILGTKGKVKLGILYTAVNEEFVEVTDTDLINKVEARAEELQEDYLLRQEEKEYKELRAKKLNDGMLTANGKMWFNERTAIMFLTKLNTYINIVETSFWKSKDNTTFKWKDKDRKVVEVTLKEAKEYGAEILSKLDEVYLG